MHFPVFLDEVPVTQVVFKLGLDIVLELTFQPSLSPPRNGFSLVALQQTKDKVAPRDVIDASVVFVLAICVRE